MFRASRSLIMHLVLPDLSSFTYFQTTRPLAWTVKHTFKNPRNRWQWNFCGQRSLRPQSILSLGLHLLNKNAEHCWGRNGPRCRPSTADFECCWIKKKTKMIKTQIYWKSFLNIIEGWFEWVPEVFYLQKNSLMCSWYYLWCVQMNENLRCTWSTTCVSEMRIWLSTRFQFWTVT